MIRENEFHFSYLAVDPQGLGPQPDLPAGSRGPSVGVALDATAGTVLTVGIGGGRDVWSALLFGQRSVLGLEINQDIIKT